MSVKEGIMTRGKIMIMVVLTPLILLFGYMLFISEKGWEREVALGLLLSMFVLIGFILLIMYILKKWK